MRGLAPTSRPGSSQAASRPVGSSPPAARPGLKSRAIRVRPCGTRGREKRRAVVLGLVCALLIALPAAAQDLERGKAVYDKYCSQCHGENGDGKGVAASRLQPEPRDFTTGKYKVRMTPTGQLPTDEDIANAIREGLGFPYTAMPPFSDKIIDDSELADLVAYVKAFSPDFADSQLERQPIEIPQPPPYTPEGAEAGREVYESTGCAACHGELGRGDGFSAPTLVDEWGNYIRTADLSRPWTFRGGGTRRDIYRTMSTGFAGTPMPGFHGALPPEDIWAITDYMLSLSGGPREGETVKAPYQNVIRAVGTDEAIELERADELFQDAPEALFPLAGQIIEPGRNFYPAAQSVTVQAIYNQDEIAFRVRWHDMRAETSGHNAPDLPVPLWDEQLAAAAGDGSESGGEDDFWGVGDAGDDAGTNEEQSDADFWGIEEESTPAGDAGAGEEQSDADFWGTEEEGDDDFWGTEDDGSGSGGGAGDGFSDAVAIQLPQALPQGVRKPYFIFGDGQYPVDLWFADLAKVAAGNGSGDAAAIAEAELWTGRGSAAVTPNDAGDLPQVVARFDRGEWSVTFKRERRSRGGLSFEPATFVPIAFSVWDGFNQERGNKRALTSWFDLYLEPLETPDPWGPMTKAFLGVLGLEILLIALVRWRRKQAAATPARTAQPSTA